MAKVVRNAPSKSPERTPATAEPRGLRWPLRAALVLSVLYVLTHFAMIPAAFALWGGLLSALVLGQ
jgi:hypothetical protein